MRWVFLSLVILNGAYFGWQFYQTNTQSTVATVPAKAQLNNIRIVTQQNQVPQQTSVDTSQQECVRLGPFPEELNARQVLTRLSALEITGDYATEEVEMVKDYWVYLPPYPDANRAKLKLTELVKKGIDSYLIATGALANGISLGLFSQKANALNRQREMQSLGYDAKIQENKQVQTGYWVQLSASGSEYFNQGLFESLKSRYLEIEQSSVPCKTVETPG